MKIFLDPIFEEEDVHVALSNTAMIGVLNLSRQFVMKDIEVTPRVFHHWALKGLVDVRPKQNEYNHVFSFVELIWFNIVNELRSYGFSLEKIKLVYDSVMEKLDFIKYINSLTDAEKEKLVNEIDEFPQEFDEYKDKMKEEFKKELFDPDFFEEEDDLQIYALYFLIYSFLAFRSNVFLYIDTNANVIAYIERTTSKKKLRELMAERSFDSESYICISLMKFFRKFVQNPNYLDFIKDNDILNENEQYILSLIREGKAKAITIRFIDEKPISIEITKEKKINTAARLSEILLNKGYQDIIIKTKNGDIAFSNVTTKKKLQ